MVERLGNLLRQPSGLVGVVIIGMYVCVAILATPLAPYSPIEQQPADRLQAPNPVHWLGTDEFGRDILSRLIHGATRSLRIAFLSVALSSTLGSAIGMLAAYVGGWLDNGLMRIMDLLFAFPALLLALAVAAALGPGEFNTLMAIVVVYLPIFARVARGTVLDIKTHEFVAAAQATGVGHGRIMLRHILPNALAPTLVQVSLALSWAILTEASLSFLGLGTVPPNPSWGAMLSESRTILEIAPWIAISSGVAIMLAVLGFNLLGDGLRDTLDPRLQSQKRQGRP